MELCQVGSNCGLDANQDFTQESLWFPHAKKMVYAWYPDPSKVINFVKVRDLHVQLHRFFYVAYCKAWNFHAEECLIPVNLTNLELSHDNSTSSSLSVFFKCKDGFRPRDEQMAVCSSNGMWLPDLAQFECHRPTAALISMILACFSIILQYHYYHAWLT